VGTPAGAAAGAVAAAAPDESRGALMALGILLLWLAGVAFFIAFEGSSLLAEQTKAAAGGTQTNWFATIVQGLTRQAAATAKETGG
jgi:hypothetical protein